MQGLKHEDYYNLYYGADRFQKKYLWKISFDEPDEMHQERFNNSAYYNLCGRTVNTYMGFLFSPPPIVAPGQVDIDLAMKLQRAAFHSLIGGVCLVVALPNGITVFNRCQFEINQAENTIIAKHADGVMQITKDKIKVTMEGEGKAIEYDREADAVQIVKWNESGMSLLADVAPLNIRLYNLEAAQDRHVLNSNFHVSDGPPVADGKIRPFQHFDRGTTSQPFAFHTPDTSGMDRIETRIEKTRMAIAYCVGLESQLSDKLTPPSGFSYQFQMFTPTSVTINMAMNLNHSFKLLCESYQKQTGQNPGSITLSPRLSIDTSTDKFNKARMIKDEIRLDSVVKASQLAMASDTFGEISPDKLKDIQKDIEQNGGLAVDRPATALTFPN